MRVFVSVNLPLEIEDKIKEIQRQIKGVDLIEAKFVKKGLFHLTLKFLGEIEEYQAEKIKEKLNEIKIQEFETEINEIGVFSEKFIKIIWLHLTNCDKLQKAVDDKLEGIFPKEKRFMSHLTIARVKKVKNKKEFLQNLKKIKIKKIKFKTDRFYLMKSELTAEGPVYEILEEFELD